MIKPLETHHFCVGYVKNLLWASKSWRFTKKHTWSRSLSVVMSVENLLKEQYISRLIWMFILERNHFLVISCGKSFKDRGTLRKHELIHMGVRAFSCTFCTRTFTQGCNFRKHQMIFKDKEHYSCSLCAKTFTEQVKFEKHQQIHLTWFNCACF